MKGRVAILVLALGFGLGLGLDWDQDHDVTDYDLDLDHSHVRSGHETHYGEIGVNHEQPMMQIWVDPRTGNLLVGPLMRVPNHLINE